MKALSFLLLFLPTVLLAQPFGSEMCRIWDGTDTAAVTSQRSLQVEGAIAEGAAYGGAPVLMGGVDYDDNNAYFADVDAADGSLRVRQSGTWNINNISGTISLPTGAATSANQSTEITSLSIIDDWDETDRAKVNPIVGQAGVQGGSGTVSATTQRVVLATDVGLPAGTASIGTVIANPGQLVYLSRASSDVDNTAVLVFDCSAANSSSKFITLTNAGDGDLYCTVNDSTPVADGSTADYGWKLAKGQTEWIPVAYKASSTDNDIYCLRAAAQTNDNVLVTQFGWAN